MKKSVLFLPPAPLSARPKKNNTTINEQEIGIVTL